MECEGVCRCCAADGPSKYLDSSYLWMGETEVYSEMLKACFDITLKAAENGKNGGICSICITQLRNAYNFKKQVLFTEEQFHRKLEDENSQVNIKLEVDPEDDGSSDHHADDDDDDDIKEYEVNIKDESAEEKAKPKRPARQSALKTKRAKIEKAETSSSQRLGKKRNKVPTTVKKKNEDILNREIEVRNFRSNLNNILKYSNATLIKFLGVKYSCVYCSSFFDKPSKLKTHIIKCHEEDKLDHEYNKTSLSKINLNLDITDVTCSVCEDIFVYLEDLTQHLSDKHGILMHKIQTAMREFNFKSDQFVCHICHSHHFNMVSLRTHMNVHYMKHCCNICGRTFVTAKRLTAHKGRHKTGLFPCQSCDKTFEMKWKLIQHIRTAHAEPLKAYQCPECPERFAKVSEKRKHLLDIHGSQWKPEFKCNACDKEFISCGKLTQHIKKDHLIERKHKCPKCDMQFFGNYQLEIHMIKHTGEKNFECDICHKCYTVKNSLREHMRKHLNDVRFSCILCGSQFLQKCSLKYHLAAKHGIGLDS